MIQRLSLGLLLLALSACSGHSPLAEPSGPYRVLNADRWTPTTDDLQPLPAVEDGQ